MRNASGRSSGITCRHPLSRVWICVSSISKQAFKKNAFGDCFVWRTVIPDIYKIIFPDSGVVGDGAVVRIGSVVRMRRPNGDIWFRVQRLAPLEIGTQSGALSSHDVCLRVVVETRDPFELDTNHATKRNHVVVRVNDPTPVNNISEIWWTPIADDSNGERIRLTADWNAIDSTVAISLFPPAATSVQVVDPAIATPFD